MVLATIASRLRLARENEWEVIAARVLNAIGARLQLCTSDEVVIGFLLEESLPPQARVILRHECRTHFGREVRFRRIKLTDYSRWSVDIGPSLN